MNAELQKRFEERRDKTINCPEFKKIKECGWFYDERGFWYTNKCHIVYCCDEFIVWKYFGKRKQWWHYQVQQTFGFANACELGLFVLKREKKAKS